jgi:hypothetical protein
MRHARVMRSAACKAETRCVRGWQDFVARCGRKWNGVQQAMGGCGVSSFLKQEGHWKVEEAEKVRKTGHGCVCERVRLFFPVSKFRSSYLGV